MCFCEAFGIVFICKGSHQLVLNWRTRQPSYSILKHLCCSTFDIENIKEHSHKSTLQLVQLKNAFSMFSRVIFQMTLVTRLSQSVARLL